jgi:hypothetical protein
VSENLKLWQSVEKTDPKYTKAFNRAGGFSGTAINATYLIRKATEQWGPIGGSWGATVEDEKYVPGADETVIHVLRIKFWHPGGNFHSYGQTTFVGKNKNGMFTDEEAPKKSLTDAITKALAMLGFSADVFLGLYDDNKYVNDRKAEFAQTTSRITPVAGSLEALEPDEQTKAKEIANGIVDLWNEGKEIAAYELFYENNLSNEMKLGIWEVLQPHSKIRNTLKKMHNDPTTKKAA